MNRSSLILASVCLVTIGGGEIAFAKAFAAEQGGTSATVGVLRPSENGFNFVPTERLTVDVTDADRQKFRNEVTTYARENGFGINRDISISVTPEPSAAPMSEKIILTGETYSLEIERQSATDQYLISAVARIEASPDPALEKLRLLQGHLQSAGFNTKIVCRPAELC